MIHNLRLYDTFCHRQELELIAQSVWIFYYNDNVKLLKHVQILMNPNITKLPEWHGFIFLSNHRLEFLGLGSCELIVLDIGH